ncbi:MBL fold metallo-hydrolase [Yinghuangia seranimata]|uniref:MBL fold metallo-hydrolase n=1 Tax=Yinghuangia seranimata TaxID=408067 RepID=UPI00248D3406|nr:MBL fold metallo-hydrolase [Yinghuangia seranimata]MDI2124557.1 MBL fold metallo-hydrolase [Yinghuangia seranimata]
MSDADSVVRFYGHAGIHVRTPNASLVMDPWFSRAGAFLSTWHQFPRNDHLDLEPLREADFVVLSHEHRDHFDIDFLRTVRRDATILIPRYTDGYLARELALHLPNEVVEMASHETLPLAPDLRLTPMVQSVPIWDDCTMVVETPRYTIANLNDMKPSAKDLKWLHDSFAIDYLFLQYSGANWHPQVYGYPPEEKQRISRHKRENKFASVLRTFTASGARWLVPSAGPPCFLDPEFFELNFEPDSIFPTQADFYEFAERAGYADRTIVLLPGDELHDKEDHGTDNKERLRHPCFTDKRAYLTEYQRERLPVIRHELAALPDAPPSMLGKLSDYFTPLIASSAFFRDGIGGRVLIESVGADPEHPEAVVLDFTRYQDPVYPYAGGDVMYRIRAEDRLLNEVLEGRLSWEELLLSLRFDARRDPDRYNEFLVVFLRFANPDSYRAYARYERGKRSDERTVVEHEGCRYEIQRYCPHAMADLAGAEIRDGSVVCPGHGWTFRLSDGGCPTSATKLAVRRLTDPR